MEDTSCEAHFSATTSVLTPKAADLEDDRQWNAYDSSHRRGVTAELNVNHANMGFSEALQLMVEGDKWNVFIPPNLTLREDGTGPCEDLDPKCTKFVKDGDALIFRVHLLRFFGPRQLLCDINTLVGCTDQAKAYVEKQRAVPMEKRLKELERLQALHEKSDDMADETRAWLLVRIGILARLTDDGPQEEQQEEKKEEL
eukprot:TRINITY_DN32604_c0_g1_i4.p1 TRINITY_DN32604_c0_g1~~TRINITY_DN32604_c0_g1_i4.p1  ORF type:complete len:199 (+),score=61.64 TRINITY_DN32604_c0_g1_i4:168-764(+)